MFSLSMLRSSTQSISQKVQSSRSKSQKTPARNNIRTIRSQKHGAKAKLQEQDIDKRYPQQGSVYKLELDCSQSNIALGLLLKPGEDGRPVIKTVRPGGKALGKCQVGDVILATTYVGLRGISKDSWGAPDRGWVDTAEVSYDDANAAMTTNSNTITLILDRAYQPKKSASSSSSGSGGVDPKAWAKEMAAKLRAGQK
jgi:hypothetical protein